MAVVSTWFVSALIFSLSFFTHQNLLLLPLVVSDGVAPSPRGERRTRDAVCKSAARGSRASPQSPYVTPGPSARRVALEDADGCQSAPGDTVEVDKGGKCPLRPDGRAMAMVSTWLVSALIVSLSLFILT